MQTIDTNTQRQTYDLVARVIFRSRGTAEEAADS